MEIEIRRRETTGAGASARNESETLAKYEIMDGAPVRGENIPIRCGLHVIWYGQRVGKLMLIGGVCGMRCLSWHALSTLHCVNIVIMEVLVG